MPLPLLVGGAALAATSGVGAAVIAWVIWAIKTMTGISNAQKENQISNLIQQWQAQGTPTDNITEGLRQAGYSQTDIDKVLKIETPKPIEQPKPLDEKKAELQLSVATPEEAMKLIRDWATQGVVSQEAVNRWWAKYTTKFDMASAQQQLGRLLPKEAQTVLDQWEKQGIGNAEDFDTLIDWYKTLPQPSDSEMQAVSRFLELGRNDLAQQTLARIPKDLADRYMEQAKYEVGLGKATTLAEMEYKGKARAEQVFGAGQTTGQQAIAFYKQYDPSKGPPPKPPTVGSFASEEEEAQMNEAYREARGKWNKELEKVSEWARPRMPAETEVAQPTIEQLGGGLATGTRLRQFLEEQGGFVSQIAGETRGARESWWNRMYPELLPRKEQASDLAKIAQRTWERSPEYQALMVGKPQLEIAEGRAGGRRYAREYETDTEAWQRRMTQAKASWQEDPLVRALREKGQKFIPEYYRQPGAGLVNRLTPAVRY